jgi:phospholipid/cholesterol/gamma-HCH transport system substrate-binding protein
VVDDLRPIVDRANSSFRQLVPVSRNLNPDTAMITSYLNDIQAFFFNTNGAFSLSDANGGFIRGHVAVPLPDAGVLPGSHGGNDGRSPR